MPEFKINTDKYNAGSSQPQSIRANDITKFSNLELRLKNFEMFSSKLRLYNSCNIGINDFIEPMIRDFETKLTSVYPQINGNRIIIYGISGLINDNDYTNELIRRINIKRSQNN